MNMDAILFDLDGTLWNSAEEVCLSWNQVLDNCPGIRKPITLEEIEGVMGLQMDVIARKMFPELPPDVQKVMLEKCVQQENAYLQENGAKLFPGIVDTLHILSRFYDLCIVSNCQCGYIEAFLKAHKLEQVFHDHICFGETGRRKAESMRILMQRNGYQHAVYVGDTQGDCDEAAHAGLTFIHAAYGFGEVKNCCCRINSPAELLNIIDQTGDWTGNHNILEEPSL